MTFEVEQMVATNRDSLIPFIWIGTSDQGTLEAAFSADESVADFQLIAGFETECLYQLEWVNHIEHVIRILVDEKATVLAATDQEDTWHLRLLFVDHDSITRTNEYCEENGIDFDIEIIHEFSNERSDRFGLTDSQQKAIRRAADRGYYLIPHVASIEELADEFDISHQALSERLRRAHGNLIDDVFLNSVGTSEVAKTAPTKKWSRSKYCRCLNNPQRQLAQVQPSDQRGQ